MSEGPQALVKDENSALYAREKLNENAEKIRKKGGTVDKWRDRGYVELGVTKSEQRIIDHIERLKEDGVDTVGDLFERIQERNDSTINSLDGFANLYAGRNEEDRRTTREDADDLRAFEIVTKRLYEEGKLSQDTVGSLKKFAVLQRHLQHLGGEWSLLTSITDSSETTRKRRQELKEEFYRVRKQLGKMRDEKETWSEDRLKQLDQEFQVPDKLRKKNKYDTSETPKESNFLVYNDQQRKAVNRLQDKEEKLERKLRSKLNSRDIYAYLSELTKLKAELLTEQHRERRPSEVNEYDPQTGTTDAEKYRELQREERDMHMQFEELRNADDHKEAYKVLKKLKRNYIERNHILARGEGLFEHSQKSEDKDQTPPEPPEEEEDRETDGERKRRAEEVGIPEYGEEDFSPSLLFEELVDRFAILNSPQEDVGDKELKRSQHQYADIIDTLNKMELANLRHDTPESVNTSDLDNLSNNQGDVDDLRSDESRQDEEWVEKVLELRRALNGVDIDSDDRLTDEQLRGLFSRLKRVDSMEENEWLIDELREIWKKRLAEEGDEEEQVKPPRRTTRR